MKGIAIDGKYEIVKQLGKGGFAKTYLARDVGDNNSTTYVLKRLLPNPDDRHAIDAFYTEARILSQLQHDCIPRAIDCFEAGGEHFLVQDYIPGDDFSKEFAIGHRWQEARIRQFLEEILDLLEYIHAQQIVHCDIKPANSIRRWRDGKLVAIDFGAGREINNKSAQTAASIGTPGYRAPEQTQGCITPACDIYATGMTAIQFATGKYPVHLSVGEDGRVQWQEDADLSCHLMAILLQMTHPNPDLRYSSAAEVRVALAGLPPIAEKRSPSSSAVWRKLPLVILAGAVLWGGVSHVVQVDRPHYPSENNN